MCYYHQRFGPQAFRCEEGWNFCSQKFSNAPKEPEYLPRESPTTRQHHSAKTPANRVRACAPIPRRHEKIENAFMSSVIFKPPAKPQVQTLTTSSPNPPRTKPRDLYSADANPSQPCAQPQTQTVTNNSSNPPRTNLGTRWLQVQI